MAILVTGGAGYIGSHTIVELLNTNREVVVLDNLSNSSEISLKRVEKITGKKVPFYKGDVLDRDILRKIFAENNIESVIHFAGLKAVGESVREPLRYYQNNVTGSIVLVEEMLKAGVNTIVFSSSATVYGDPQIIPIVESCPVGGTTNPYGTSKYMVERILEDTVKAFPQLSAVILRYFNPVGAHSSGLIGEDPNGIPNNLMPIIMRVHQKQIAELSVFGDDYETRDGSCIRDYIHVVDLAVGHILAMEHMQPGVAFYNLGTGNGTTVFEMIKAFEKAAGEPLPYKVAPRRAGDLACLTADATKAKEELGWVATHTVEDAMRDTIKFLGSA